MSKNPSPQAGKLDIDKYIHIIYHTVSMNTQRVTVSLPDYLYTELRLMLGRGDLSSFMAEAAEEKMLDEKLTPKDPIKAFFAHKEYLPKLTTKQILVNIRKGRT